MVVVVVAVVIAVVILVAVVAIGMAVPVAVDLCACIQTNRNPTRACPACPAFPAAEPAREPGICVGRVLVVDMYGTPTEVGTAYANLLGPRIKVSYLQHLQPRSNDFLRAQCGSFLALHWPL